MKSIACCSLGALSLCSVATASDAQQLQAVGVSGSFHIVRLKSAQDAFVLNSVTINPLSDQSNDETGNGATLYGRWRLGHRGWYVQPELGYLSALETPVEVLGARSGGPYAGSRIKRLDVRLLGGYQAGPLRLFAGPVLGYYLFNNLGRASTDPELQAAYDALNVRPDRVQATVQVGTGVTFGRFDLNARYEWGLSPYKRINVGPFQPGQFERRLQQLVLETGFQLYKRPVP